jgi:outer membrane lipoprotein SlyB
MRANRLLPLAALCASALMWLAPMSVPAQPAPPPPPLAPSVVPAGPVPKVTGTCDRCGTVESINQVTGKDQWTPLGSVPSSSDLGPTGVAVYQIGKGFSNQGQVFIGAAGGGSYQTRANQRNVTRWEIVVKMDDGSSRSVVQNYEPLFVAGDRVHVFGTQIELVQ